MAVKKDTRAEDEQLNRFWPRYKKYTLTRAITLQILICLIATGVILVLYPNLTVDAWIVIVTLSGMAVATTLISTTIAMKPVRELSSALVHVSGEPTNLTPPNINDNYYARNRMRPLLKQIYETASGARTTSKLADAASMPNVVGQLNQTSTGIIMLNEAKEVIYANQSAPISIDSTGKKNIELIFDADQPILDWITERGNNDIHAEKTWKRIANKLTGEENRRIFDIHVSYQRGSEAETIITLLDRTENYLPDDDDLDFIAFAAHELRGPITVIRGYLDTLNDELSDVCDSDQKELFQRLIVSANRLSSYVNNILNASRYDRRHLRVHIGEHHVNNIYHTIADDMEMRAQAQHRQLNVVLPETLPTVAADQNSMSEVFANLIDNAIKYSNDGGVIEVAARHTGDFVDVSVTDNGIGMPGNVVGNLFHKFYRSHRSRETVAGTGIGLYITKAIVESNGGHISVKSVEGHGSTFTVSLPTYASVSDKLTKDDENNDVFLDRSSDGWIKNHGAFRG